jgi:hypothetical protein
MANRYFVGGSGAKNWNDIANWSTASGGAGGASVPTSADNVYFDAASLSGACTLTLNAIANCLDLDFSGLDNAFLFTSSVYVINIYGSLTLTANLTWTFTGTAYTYFRAIDSRRITTNSVIFSANNVIFDGIGGSWAHQDNSTMPTNVELLNGTWKTNNKTITIGPTGNGFIRSDRSMNTRRIELGSSTIYGGVYLTQPTGFTIDAGLSTVVSENYILCHASSGNLFNLVHKGHPVIGSSSGTIGYFLCNSFICNNLVGRANLCITGNITIEGILTLTGFNSSTKRCFLNSPIVGTQKTIAATNIVASNIDFIDIQLSGACNKDLSNITGGSGDCGGNSGIIFTPGQKQFYKHTSGTCNWSDQKWFASSGGAIAGRVPLPQDDAIFDTNSFTGASTLTLDCPRVGRNLDFSTITKSVAFVRNVSISVFGNLILSPLISFIADTGYFFYLYSQSNTSESTLNTFNIVYGQQIIIYRGRYILQNNLIAGAFSLSSVNCAFDANDFNITSGITLNSGTFYAGNGILTGLANNLAGVTFYCEGSTVIPLETFFSENKVYAILKINVNTNFINSTNYPSNTVGELIITRGCNIKFTAGTIMTFSKVTMIGATATFSMIGSITNAPHTLALAAGNPEVECDYLNLSYSSATPANKFFAGSHSVNGGNNTGWIFSDMARFITYARTSGMASGLLKLQSNSMLHFIAHGTTLSKSALFHFRKIVAQAVGTTTDELQLYTERYLVAIASGETLADSYVRILLPIASEASGSADTSTVIHQLIYTAAVAFGISLTEATLLVYAYPVEVFQAISKITTIITKSSKVF